MKLLVTEDNHYYTTGVQKLRIPTGLNKVIELGREYGSYICGGYARYAASSVDKPVTPSDIDIFCRDQKAFDALERGLERLFPEVEVRESKFAMNFHTHKQFKYPIQLIKPKDNGVIHNFGKVYDVLDTFDFSIARAAILSPTSVLLHSHFERDENFGLLRILAPIQNPFRIMLRVSKYASKGYTLPPLEIIRLFAAWENYTPEYRETLMGSFAKLDSPGYGFGRSIPTSKDMSESEKEMMYEIFWGAGK